MSDDPLTECTGLRSAGATGLPPRRRPLQGLGLLQHRLRHEEAPRPDGERRSDSSSVRRRLVHRLDVVEDEDSRLEVVVVRRPRRRPSSSEQLGQLVGYCPSSSFAAGLTLGGRAPMQASRRRGRDGPTASARASGPSRPSPGRATGAAGRAAQVGADRPRRMPGDPGQAEERAPATAPARVMRGSTCCWRSAAVDVVLARVAHVLADARERRAPACRSGDASPFGRAEHVAVVERVARHDAALQRHVDAAQRVDELREVVEVDLDQVVDLQAVAEVPLDRLDRQRRRRRTRRRR